MNKVKVRDFLKERILIDKNGGIHSHIDEVEAAVKMFVKIKCREQIEETMLNMEFEFNSEDEICGIKPDSVFNSLLKIE